MLPFYNSVEKQEGNKNQPLSNQKRDHKDKVLIFSQKHLSVFPNDYLTSWLDCFQVHNNLEALSKNQELEQVV